MSLRHGFRLLDRSRKDVAAKPRSGARLSKNKKGSSSSSSEVAPSSWFPVSLSTTVVDQFLEALKDNSGGGSSSHFSSPNQIRQKLFQLNIDLSATDRKTNKKILPMNKVLETAARLSGHRGEWRTALACLGLQKVSHHVSSSSPRSSSSQQVTVITPSDQLDVVHECPSIKENMPEDVKLKMELEAAAWEERVKKGVGDARESNHRQQERGVLETITSPPPKNARNRFTSLKRKASEGVNSGLELDDLSCVRTELLRASAALASAEGSISRASSSLAVHQRLISAALHHSAQCLRLPTAQQRYCEFDPVPEILSKILQSWYVCSPSVRNQISKFSDHGDNAVGNGSTMNESEIISFGGEPLWTVMRRYMDSVLRHSPVSTTMESTSTSLANFPLQQQRLLISHTKQRPEFIATVLRPLTTTNVKQKMTGSVERQLLRTHVLRDVLPELLGLRKTCESEGEGNREHTNQSNSSCSFSSSFLAVLPMEPRNHIFNRLLGTIDSCFQIVDFLHREAQFDPRSSAEGVLLEAEEMNRALIALSEWIRKVWNTVTTVTATSLIEAVDEKEKDVERRLMTSSSNKAEENSEDGTRKYVSTVDNDELIFKISQEDEVHLRLKSLLARLSRVIICWDAVDEFQVMATSPPEPPAALLPSLLHMIETADLLDLVPPPKEMIAAALQTIPWTRREGEKDYSPSTMEGSSMLSSSKMEGTIETTTASTAAGLENAQSVIDHQSSARKPLFEEGDNFDDEAEDRYERDTDQRRPKLTGNRFINSFAAELRAADQKERPFELRVTRKQREDATRGEEHISNFNSARSDTTATRKRSVLEAIASTPTTTTTTISGKTEVVEIEATDEEEAREKLREMMSKQQGEELNSVSIKGLNNNDGEEDEDLLLPVAGPGFYDVVGRLYPKAVTVAIVKAALQGSGQSSRSSSSSSSVGGVEKGRGASRLASNGKSSSSSVATSSPSAESSAKWMATEIRPHGAQVALSILAGVVEDRVFQYFKTKNARPVETEITTANNTTNVDEEREVEEIRERLSTVPDAFVKYSLMGAAGSQRNYSCWGQAIKFLSSLSSSPERLGVDTSSSTVIADRTYCPPKAPVLKTTSVTLAVNFALRHQRWAEAIRLVAMAGRGGKTDFQIAAQTSSSSASSSNSSASPTSNTVLRPDVAKWVMEVFSFDRHSPWRSAFQVYEMLQKQKLMVGLHRPLTFVPKLRGGDPYEHGAYAAVRHFRKEGIHAGLVNSKNGKSLVFPFDLVSGSPKNCWHYSLRILHELEEQSARYGGLGGGGGSSVLARNQREGTAHANSFSAARGVNRKVEGETGFIAEINAGVLLHAPTFFSVLSLQRARFVVAALSLELGDGQEGEGVRFEDRPECHRRWNMISSGKRSKCQERAEDKDRGEIDVMRNIDRELFLESYLQDTLDSIIVREAQKPLSQSTLGQDIDEWGFYESAWKVMSVIKIWECLIASRELEIEEDDENKDDEAGDNRCLRGKCKRDYGNLTKEEIKAAFSSLRVQLEEARSLTGHDTHSRKHQHSEQRYSSASSTGSSSLHAGGRRGTSSSRGLNLANRRRGLEAQANGGLTSGEEEQNNSSLQPDVSGGGRLGGDDSPTGASGTRREASTVNKRHRRVGSGDAAESMLDSILGASS